MVNKLNLFLYEMFGDAQQQAIIVAAFVSLF